MIRIVINGFGRIGRAALKLALEAGSLEVVAINDLMPVENAAYLLKLDSIYGRYDKSVETHNGKLRIAGKSIAYFSIRDPIDLPWKELQIDVVIECTGLFTSLADAEKHRTAGAKIVVLSGPAKSPGISTVVFGVNTADGQSGIFSCASCTTNNISPLIEILGRRVGIKKAILNTVHAYTASQALVDAPSKRDFRMGRAAGANLTPSSTGAAIATTKALPQYAGKFDGVAIRTPVSIGSISDITFIAERATSAEEINEILEQEAQSERYRKVVSVTREPLVSSDIIQSTFAAIVDLELTRVVDGDLVKVMAWYDNERGFSSQMIRQIIQLNL